MSQELQQEVDLTFLYGYYSTARSHNNEIMLEFHLPTTGFKLELKSIEELRPYFKYLEYDPIYKDRQTGSSYNRLRLWLKNDITYKPFKF